MENRVDKYKDKPLNAKLSYNLLFVLIIVVTNVIATFTFLHYSISQGEQHTDSFSLDAESRRLEMLMLQFNASRKDMEDTVFQLMQVRKDLQNLSMQVTELIKGTPANDRVQEVLKQFETEDNPWYQWASGVMAKELREYTSMRRLPFGWNPAFNSDSLVSSVGHACALHKSDMDAFMDYTVGGDCPDDESLAQKLLLGGCEPLPRRRCLARKPFNSTEPVPFPESVWTLPDDNNFLWTAHPCKSFECLNERPKKKVSADCLDCFDLDGREKHRWVGGSGSLDFTIEDVVNMKPKGTVKIGLDIGGGTASFAARMRELNVTIVTSTLNLDGPFNNFIAHRGLVPLFLTVSQRLPFADNTLDIVHSMHVLSNWIPTESLEFILYDIYRILRPGGLFWLDHFFCVEHQVDTYIPMIEKFGYTKHRWTVGLKLDRGPELMERYISALLEKPM